jgi:hypothetical protein
MAIVGATAAANAQQIDRSSPPVTVEGAGGFAADRMPGRPGIDGRAWMLADVHAGKAEVFRPDGADYELELKDPDNSGDAERWTVTFTRAGRAPVPLDAGRKTAFVYVTPDARYIFLEPLTVVDVVAWRRYDLSTTLGIEPYVTIRAIRAGGRELFLDRSTCVADCANRSDEEYFDLTIPSGN